MTTRASNLVAAADCNSTPQRRVDRHSTDGIEASPNLTVWLRHLLTEFEGPLLRYAHRLTGNLELAREVVQDTFLRCCRANRDEVASHAGRWLFCVCRNRALDVLRKEQRMNLATEPDIQSIAGGAGPPDLVEQREAAGQLMLFLERLPPGQQEVIRLKFQNGLRYREIADVTGQSVSHVGVLLHQGLKRLRELLQAAE